MFYTPSELSIGIRVSTHVVVPNRVPIVCSTSKPSFRSQPKILDGLKFVPTYHHCGVIGHIRLQRHKLKREQNQVGKSLPKSLVDLNTLFVTIVVLLVI